MITFGSFYTLVHFRSDQERAMGIREVTKILRPHQVDAVGKIDRMDSLLVVHGTGSGKTLTALICAFTYLESHARGLVCVVSPAGIVGNFEKERERYSLPPLSRFKFYSFDKLSRDIGAGKVSEWTNSEFMLIIDEAHSLRSMGVWYTRILQMAKKSEKLILLTATPFINELGDMIPLVNLINRKEGKLTVSDVRKFEGSNYIMNKIVEMLEGRISYSKIETSYLSGLAGEVNNSHSMYGYPDVYVEKVDMIMTREFYITYRTSLFNSKDYGKNPTSFYSGYRRATNACSEYTNQKLDVIYQIVSHKVEKERVLKTLVYTNWLDNGISILEKFFVEKKLLYASITGSTAPRIRMKIVEEYNRGSFDILIITKAGSEGLDLVETRNIIVLDPVWSPSILEQIIGRGARFGSHAKLPKGEQKVNVYLLCLNAPPYAEVPSGDTLLYDILYRKLFIKNNMERALRDH